MSTGWPKVRDQCAQFGVRFDDWQQGAGELIFAKRADGSYACSVGGVVISIPRQVGKTFLVGAIVFALCLLRPGLQVVWTAHHSATSGETFRTLKGFALRKKVAPHIHKVLEDDQWIEFKNGSRIMFGARERGFGRGFTNIGMLVFDEAQILSERALSDMVPTQNTAEHPLLFFMGTPPKPTDPSEAFTRKRAEVLSGEDEDTAYIEFSADHGCNPDDRKQWRKGNPSYPKRTPEAAMLRMKKNLTPESYMREGLGVWDEDGTSKIVTRDQWRGAGDSPESEFTIGARVLAWEINTDLSWSSIAWVGERGEVLHSEVVDSQIGTEWVAARIARYVKGAGSLVRAVCYVGGSPAQAIAPDVEKALKADESTVEVIKISASEFAAGCGDWYAKTVAGSMRHIRQAWLTNAVDGAVWRNSGEARVFDRKKATDEITPLTAVAVALRGLEIVPVAELVTPGYYGSGEED